MESTKPASCPPKRWPASRPPRFFRPRTTLAWLALAATVISAGCVRTVHEPLLIREPRPEPVPLRIGIYYPPEVRKFSYHREPGQPLIVRAYVLGEPSVRLLNEAFAQLFVEVVELPGPGSDPALRSDLAGTIEARITSAGYQDQVTLETSPGQISAHITYGFTLYSPRGERVASWDVTGSRTEPVVNPFGGVSATRRTFGRAMRDAAWKLTSGFRDVPEIRRWLDEQGVR